DQPRILRAGGTSDRVARRAEGGIPGEEHVAVGSGRQERRRRGGRLAPRPGRQLDLQRVLNLVHRDLALDLLAHVGELALELRVDRRHLARGLRKVLAINDDGDDDDENDFAEREAFHSWRLSYVSTRWT